MGNSFVMKGCTLYLDVIAKTCRGKPVTHYYPDMLRVTQYIHLWYKLYDRHVYLVTYLEQNKIWKATKEAILTFHNLSIYGAVLKNAGHQGLSCRHIGWGIDTFVSLPCISVYISTAEAPEDGSACINIHYIHHFHSIIFQKCQNKTKCLKQTRTISNDRF